MGFVIKKHRGRFDTTEYVKEVKKMNNMTSDDIITGSYIIIPYYISEEKQE